MINSLATAFIQDLIVVVIAWFFGFFFSVCLVFFLLNRKHSFN